MAEKTSFYSRLSRKTQIALICAGLFVIIGCCAAAVGLYAHFTKTEGTYEPETEPDTVLNAALSEKSGLANYIAGLLNEASDSSKRSVKKEVNLSVENVNCGSDGENGVLSFVINGILGNMKSLYETHDGSFADGYAALPAMKLTEADIAQISTEVENGDEADKTGKLSFGITTTGGAYPGFVTDGIKETFSCGETGDIIKKTGEALSEAVSIKEYSLSSDGFTVSGNVSMADNKLSDISVKRIYNVKMTAEFTGKYASFGTKSINFSFTSEQKYTFEWAGISIAEDRITVSPKQEQMLSVSAVTDKKAVAGDYTVSFTSSDESIATVNSDGIVKGLSLSPKPVIITVNFEYLGNTYSDSCEVYVINEVEKITVTPEAITLQTGATYLLNTALKPGDATITAVTWHTENADIASVDENGVVTAAAAGETKVFAVSDDGHFRASCIVTVTSGGASNG